MKYIPRLRRYVVHWNMLYEYNDRGDMGRSIDTDTTDEYQERYLKHQARKKEVLIQIMKERHSNRMFDDKEVEKEKLDELVELVKLCPSSCDRQGVKVKVITDRDQKALLGGILVGGVGWIHRAPAILLLLGDPVAYKAGDEIDFMPYLDGGVMVQQLSLAAIAMGLHGAFANPNIREVNKKHFHEVFGEGIFCGAFAVGYPHPDSDKADKDVVVKDKNKK